MIEFTRTTSLLSGVIAEAIPWAAQLAARATELTGKEVRLSMPVGGNPYRLRWSTSAADLAEFEVGMAKTVSDRKYQELVAMSSKFTVSGALHDEFWRSLPA